MFLCDKKRVNDRLGCLRARLNESKFSCRTTIHRSWSYHQMKRKIVTYSILVDSFGLVVMQNLSRISSSSLDWVKFLTSSQRFELFNLLATLDFAEGRGREKERKGDSHSRRPSNPPHNQTLPCNI